MPISKYNKYFGPTEDSASKAESAMEQKYGAKKGKSVFYATMNKHKNAGIRFSKSRAKLGGQD